MKFLLMIVYLFSSTIFSKDFFNKEVKTIKVTKGIHMLMHKGGNIGVSSGADGVYIVDDQFADSHKAIVKAIKKISKKPIKFVLNTHWHGDHTGGNELMAKAGSTIIAHENVRKRMSKENFNTALKRKVPASSDEALPKITFPNSIEMHLNGENTQVVHLSNAHTDGDAVVFFKSSNVLHTGDLFINGFYPFIDIDSGGSLRGLIAAVKKILTMVDSKTKIIPGHGELSNKKQLQAYLKLLEDIESRISRLIKKKVSLADAQKQKPLADLDAVYGKGFVKPEVFLGLVYSSLSQ